jgi:hypothetical protein
LQSRNGRVFSKFLISVSINPSDYSYISIWRGIANPNGSRNWEVDPLKLKHWKKE